MNTFESTEGNMILLGEQLQKSLGGQVQYLVRYFDESCCKSEGREFLGEGLRIEGSAGNYHDMKIDRDDLPEAIKRLRKLKEREKDNTGEGQEKDKKEEIDINLLPLWARGEQ